MDYESLPILNEEEAMDFESLPILDEQTALQYDPPVDAGKMINEEEKKRSRGGLETAADIAFPAAGGIAGGVLGGPPGVVVGSSVGKGVQEAAENYLGVSKDRPWIANPLKEESILGNVVGEGLWTYIGGKPTKAVLGAVGKGVKAAASDVGEKIGLQEIVSSYPKFKKNLSRTWNKISRKLKPEEKETFIIDNSIKIGERLGVPGLAVERVFRRGPNKVLRDSFNRTQEMPKASIDQVASSFNRAIGKLSKEFEDRIIPVLNKDKSRNIDLTDSFEGYVSSLSDLFEISGEAGGKLIERATTDKAVAKTFNDLGKDILNTFSADDASGAMLASAEGLHKFKQYLNKVIDKKAIRDNPQAKRTLIDLKDGISKNLEVSVPGYRDLMQRYRSVYELKDEIGKKLDPLNVETALKQYFNKDKAAFRSRINDLMSKDKRVNDAWNYALDQRSAKYFKSFVEKEKQSIGVGGLPGVLGSMGTRVQAFGKTGEKVRSQLRKKERRGSLYKSGSRVFTERLGQLGAGAGVREAKNYTFGGEN